MLNRVSESKMHIIRWVLVIGWLLLIFSLFYDPISHHLSDPNNSLSPFRDRIISLAKLPDSCVRVQGECLSETPYPMGTRFFWGMIVPCAIAIVFVFGHETWRRICPLYFLSQIPRTLGLEPRLNISKNSWLVRNHIYVQFALLFIGLNCRILFINSACLVFGFFLVFTILAAITIVWLYGGRSWCHYVCPFGMVQMVFTGPRGLLGSQAHQAPPRSITQSMCRTIDSNTSKETSACISCKSPCLDIDAERTYWEYLAKPGRKLLQYGYLGLVSGYFFYYYLYAGNFNYYFSGVWTHEENQLATLFKPGFYLFERAIAIPKLVAVPLTLAFSVGICCLIGSKFEKILFSYFRKRDPHINRQQVLHRVFTLCTFIAFNAFFVYGGRPEILRLPLLVQLTFNAAIVLVSTIWLYRTWGRSYEQYSKESLANKLRRQLKKLSFDFSQFLERRSLDELNSDELYVLATVLPKATRQDRDRVYKGILTEALSEKRFEPDVSKEALQQLRDKLQLRDEEHDRLLTEIIQENPKLINPVSSKNSELSLAKTKFKALRNKQSGNLAKPIQTSYLYRALTQVKGDRHKRPKGYSQDVPTKIRKVEDKID
ncbi:4Fe-4S binding protein [Myxosarcina sp. GI1]|uniref:4Fe-4S binding protein n=1 Tax=Myxosarcina sp. GI1 TaxID=1541065 RepID=UPI0009DD7E60|nr:4Fe-4S binding protein [Myxosarcina sp. GI1]